LPTLHRSFRDFILVILSSCLLVLPFHFGELGALGYFSFIPYFLALRDKTPGEAFGFSFLFGVFFFTFLGYWLTLVNVFGFFLLVLYLALYFAVFGWIASKFLNKNTSSMFFIAAFWVALEYVRGWMIGGLPWALLGYSQWKQIVFIQIAEITGAYGVSYFVILVNLLLFKGFSKKTDSKAWVVLCVVFSGVTLYGILSLRSRDAFYTSEAPKAIIRVAVLQGNIPQEKKWDARIKDIIFEKYKRLMLMSAIEKADLIVWPETSFPGFLEDEPVMAANLRGAIRQSQTQVLVGAPTMGNLDEGLRFYNSAVLYNASGEEKKRYNKVHLVPFGEYVPFEPLIGFIRHFVSIGHFNAGDEKTIFTVGTRYEKINIKAKFAALICYEDIFPGLVRDFCRNGADFLVNITNDAWFGKTTAPYQHTQASIFRAVENRIPVVRSTNTGFSCFISPEGRILARVEDNGKELFVTSHKNIDLILRKGRSFYTRFGDVFMLFVALLCVLAWRVKSGEHIYSRL